MNAPFGLMRCDHCGGYYSEFEFAETIEEHLCERCASGIEEDGPDCDGMEYGYPDPGYDGD